MQIKWHSMIILIFKYNWTLLSF